MSEDPRPPRTWMPLAIAGGIAVLVIVGAMVFTALTQRLSASEQEAVSACEEAFAASEHSAEIAAGDVYVAAEWRDLEQFLTEQELVADEPDAEAMDAAAAALADSGRDLVEVVWWLSDETHHACTVEVVDGSAVTESLVLAPPARLPLVTTTEG